jgi:hypothetical protein
MIAIYGIHSKPMQHNDPITKSMNAIGSHIYHAYADYDFHEAGIETSAYLRGDYIQGQFDAFSDAAQASPTQFIGVDYVIQSIEGGAEPIGTGLRKAAIVVRAVIKKD